VAGLARAQAQLERKESLLLDMSSPRIPTEELRDAYARVRASPSPDSWMAVEVRRGGMVLDGEGTGGVDALRERFRDKEFMFGYLKTARPPHEQPVYVLVAYMSPKAPSMAKAKGSVASQFAASVFEVRPCPPQTAAVRRDHTIQA
jgi:hypothetical protein